VKISIANPCQKIEWSKMSNIERGKFCTLCSKKVIDFSALSDEEVIFHLTKSKKTICARLNNSQMNRVLSKSNQKRNVFWDKIMASLIVISFSSNISLSNSKVNNLGNEILHHKDYYNKSTIKSNLITSQDSIKNIIKGVVLEKDINEPFFTTVFIKNTDISVETDSLGCFQIILPDDFNKDIFTLVVPAIGLENDTEIELKLSDLPFLNMVITKEPMAIGQLIIERKKRWWQFWKKSYKDNR